MRKLGDERNMLSGMLMSSISVITRMEPFLRDVHILSKLHHANAQFGMR